MTWEAVVAGFYGLSMPLGRHRGLIAGADPVIAGLTRDLLNTRVVPIVKEMADPCPP